MAARAKTPRGTRRDGERRHREHAGAGGGAELTRTLSGVPTLGANDRVADALIAFVEDRTTYESTAAHDSLADEIRAAVDFNDAALVPMRHKMFSFENAILFGFFLVQAQQQLGDEAPAAPFDIMAYYAHIAAVYDRAMDSNVLEYFDEGDDESEEESEEEPEDGEAGQ